MTSRKRSNGATLNLAGLPVEILDRILSVIAPNNDNTAHIDRAIIQRRFLSAEALPPPDPHQDSAARSSYVDLKVFRLVNRRFAGLAAPFLFNQIVVKFSVKELNKLQKLTSWSHLARLVKRFSYLVPYFIEGGLNNLDRIKEDLRKLGLDASHLAELRQREREQRGIIDRQLDREVLKSAVRSFTSLQHIQLLRVTTKQDDIVLQYLRDHSGAVQHVNLDWVSASIRASRTIGNAVLASNTTRPSRVSLPHVPPASAKFLRTWAPSSASALAERLTCLTLHFEYSEDLTAQVRELSDFFKAFFLGAKRMKSVHIGFPAHRPLTLPLESVFHNVVWEDLLAFGVQGWELEAEEIIGMLCRHKAKLRCVRLRDVYLNEGSLWRDVLVFLREEMSRLLWVSLGGIGYAAHLHSGVAMGTELPDFFDDSDDDEDFATAGPGNDPVDEGTHTPDSDGTASEDDEDGHSDNESSGLEMHESPGFDDPHVTPPSSSPLCTCGGRQEDPLADAVQELGDNGWVVDTEKRRMWEKWALRRCPRHGIRS